MGVIVKPNQTLIHQHWVLANHSIPSYCDPKIVH